MKVIKQVEPKEWAYKFTCSGCDSELEAEADDVSVTHYDGDFRETPYDSWSVSCPLCAHATTILEDKIPKIIRVKTKQKKSYGGPMDR